MSKINAMLSERLQKSEPSQKMKALAKQSADGQLTSFSGIFSLSELTQDERQGLEEILLHYGQDLAVNIEKDLHSLITITSEVKAIQNQAALLHGERIKRAQSILKDYREGAFTSWLIRTYGNRQTPYNLLLYYEFYESLPSELKQKVEHMPRQVVYTLASRTASQDEKQEIIASYQGQTKQEMLSLIRKLFPLRENDKRRSSIGDTIIAQLEKNLDLIESYQVKLGKQQKHRIRSLLERMLEEISG